MAINARIFALGCEFLTPYMEPYGCLTPDARDADLILAANSTRPNVLDELREIRQMGKPLAWWTIEDPNSFEAFLDQARLADFVFTADAACIPRYQERLGHERVFPLPLACSPAFHHAADPAPDAAEFVISANWYANEARLWSVSTVVEPLRRAGRDLALYCYEDFMWPQNYRRYWRGRTYYLTVADQYRHGRVVLGVNNQRSGLDGRTYTVMTSMRTFEALGCGKPFLAAHSDAYEYLGLRHGEHLAAVSSPREALDWADRLLGSDGRRMAEAGRAYVLEHHTYRHRLQAILDAVYSAAAALRPALPNPHREETMTLEEQTAMMEQRLVASRKPARREVLRSLARESDNGNMRYPELLALGEAMLAFPWKTGNYVCEIGAFHGRTSAFLGRLAETAKLPCRIVSVDSFESPYLAGVKPPSAEYYRTLASHGLFPARNQVVHMRSAAAAPFLPPGIGLLLVDGARDRPQCLADLETYGPKLRPSGFLAIDDVWYEPVRRAMDEFLRANGGYTKEVQLEKLEIYRKHSA